jgi:hypothetical protein
MFHVQTAERQYTYGETSIGTNGQIENYTVNGG